MKIVKACCNEYYVNKNYYIVFDVMPKTLFRKEGNDYIGAARDKNGSIVFSHHLRHGLSGAFAGRTLALDMEDGTTEKIANWWWDVGPYKGHGDFIQIGAGTIEDLQKGYAYTAKYINRAKFEKMLAEYLKGNSFETYDAIRKWVDFQCDWWRVKVRGKKLPLLVNHLGVFIDPETKERKFADKNLLRYYTAKDGKNKSFTLRLFKFSYMENGRKITVETTMEKALKESLAEKPEIRLKKGVLQKIRGAFPRKEKI